MLLEVEHAMRTKQKFKHDDGDSVSDGCNVKSDNGDNGEYEDVGDHSGANTLSPPP